MVVCRYTLYLYRYKYMVDKTTLHELHCRIHDNVESLKLFSPPPHIHNVIIRILLGTGSLMSVGVVVGGVNTTEDGN